MTEARMSAESAQSGGVLAKILRRFAAMSAAAANLLRPSRAGLAKGQAESGAVKAETAAAALTANPHVVKEPQIEAIAHFVPDQQVVPDQQEIERRRNLVRIFFNDFWGGASDKPAGFVERLDQAENYLNERLAANSTPTREQCSGCRADRVHRIRLISGPY